MTTARSSMATSLTPSTGARPPARAGQECGIMTSRCAGKAVAARRRAYTLPLIHWRQCEGVTRAGRRSAACRGLAVCCLFAFCLGAPNPPALHLAAHPCALLAACTGQRPSNILRRNTYYTPNRFLSPAFIDTMLAQLALPNAGSFTLYLTPSPTPAGQPTSSFDFRTGLQLDIQKYWKRTPNGAAMDGDAGNINWVKGATVAFLPFSAGRYINRARPSAPNLARPSARMRSCRCRLLSALKGRPVSVRSRNFRSCLLQGCGGCCRQPKLRSSCLDTTPASCLRGPCLPCVQPTSIVVYKAL